MADSYNMQLLGYLSYGQQTSDITGFYQDGREFAVIGLQNTTSFVDVTDPASPFEVGRIDGSNSIWRDLKYWNRHVYIGTEADDGIKVVNVDDPDNPVLVHTITDVDNSHNIHIDDGYLYIVGADEYDIWIYDLVFPGTPNLVGTWNGEYIHDLDVKNNLAYAMGIYSSTAYIIDVSDKTNPQTLTSWQYPGMAHDAAVSEDGNYLVTADEMTGGNLKLWDIQDYSNINLLDEFTVNPEHSVHNVYIKDGLVYSSYYADGTRIYDISTLNFIEVGYYDTSEIDGLYVGNWGIYVYLPSGNILASDIETGLYILSYGGVTIQHSDITDQSYGSGDIEVEAIVESVNGSVESVNLHYNLNNSDNWQDIPMDLTTLPNNSYTANIPLPADQIVVSYFISASNADGQESFYPALGQNDPIIFFVGDIPAIYSETFEFETSQWSVSGDATDGIWEAGEPTGTYYGDTPVAPENDATEDGDICFVTGNTAPPNTPSDDDVDGGETILTSPSIDISEAEEVVLTYYRWFTNNLGDNPSTDRWKVQASYDGGLAWVDIENTNISDNSWTRKLFFLSGYIEFTNNVQLRFVAEDIFHEGEFGSGGSIVEAGIDDINLFSIGTITDLLAGDINFDGIVDILDIVLTVNFVLSVTDPSVNEFEAADMNSDGSLDVLDVVIIVNLILG